MVSEDAMVLEFLASEIDSPRFADVVLAALAECGADETVIRGIADSLAGWCFLA